MYDFVASTIYPRQVAAYDGDLQLETGETAAEEHVRRRFEGAFVRQLHAKSSSTSR